MSKIDALTHLEQDARQAVLKQITRLETEATRIRIHVINHEPPTTTTLRARTEAITDAIQIWAATLTAMDRTLGARNAL
jgi:hypothetical protein